VDRDDHRGDRPVADDRGTARRRAGLAPAGARWHRPRQRLRAAQGSRGACPPIRPPVRGGGDLEGRPARARRRRGSPMPCSMHSTSSTRTRSTPEWGAMTSPRCGARSSARSADEVPRCCTRPGLRTHVLVMDKRDEGSGRSPNARRMATSTAQASGLSERARAPGPSYWPGTAMSRISSSKSSSSTGWPVKYTRW